jgi:hypothetical protein
VVPVDLDDQLPRLEVIDFVDGRDRHSAAHTVTAVDRTNLTITVSPGDRRRRHHDGRVLPVRASSDSTVAVPNNSQNAEIQGLASDRGSTGTLHGVNPSTYGFWKSYQKAIGGAISDTVLRDAKDGVGFESGADLESGLDFAIITTRGIRRRYADTLTALKQVHRRQASSSGGFTAVMFDENPIFVDDQCPVGNVYGLALKNLFWAQMSDWDWMDEDGKVLKWDTAPRTATWRTCTSTASWAPRARNTHFKLTSITDDEKCQFILNVPFNERFAAAEKLEAENDAKVHAEEMDRLYEQVGAPMLHQLRKDGFVDSTVSYPIVRRA